MVRIATSYQIASSPSPNSSLRSELSRTRGWCSYKGDFLYRPEICRSGF